MRLFYIITISILLVGCQQSTELPNPTTSDHQSGGNDKGVGFTSLPAEKTGIHFMNTLNEDAGRNTLFFDYFFNGGGVAIGDVNNDNLPDIFFSGNDAPTHLYINKGNMQFEDVSAGSIPLKNRWATGVNMVDINNDGHLDIYVGYSGPDKLPELKVDEFLINDGSGKFTDRISDFGLDIPLNTIHTSFFDYDNDGDLDLWLNTHGNFTGDIDDYINQANTAPAEVKKMITTHLFRNDDGKYTDVSVEAGVER